MQDRISRLRDRWSRWIFLLWLAFAVVLYLIVTSGPHTHARAVEFWVAVAVSFVVAAVLAGWVRVDQPGRSLAWRAATAPWLWLRWIFTRRAQRRRNRQVIMPMYVRNSELYRASVEWQNLPPFIRQAKGLPPYHDDSEWR